LLRNSSISRIASSSISLRYSFIHHHLFIQLFAAVFIRSFHVLHLHPAHCSSIHSFIHSSPLLHPALCCGIHSFISRITSSSIAWLQYSFIHHHFSIQLFAAVFIRLSHALLLHPALCCNSHSLIPTHSFFIHRCAWLNHSSLILHPSLLRFSFISLRYSFISLHC
jgi:hypothetical protein